jgi:predicted transcriptional regulator
MTDNANRLADLTAAIVSAYASSNTIPAVELPELIKTVHNSLARAIEPQVEAVEETVRLTPAQIRKSITADALISFIDGKPYQTLKRHLTRHGLTVAEYKARFGLPSNYPTTAPAYSERRAAMARAIGLGRKAVPVAPVVAAAANSTSKKATKVVGATGASARRGRPKKAGAAVP